MDTDPRSSKDPHIAAYERENYSHLPPGWFTWGDMQKRVHMVFRNGQKEMLKEPPTVSAVKPNQTTHKGFFGRMFGR